MMKKHEPDGQQWVIIISSNKDNTDNLYWDDNAIWEHGGAWYGRRGRKIERRCIHIISWISLPSTATIDGNGPSVTPEVYLLLMLIII